jgi:outer membrane protein TolC
MPSLEAVALSLTLTQAITRAEHSGFPVRLATAGAQSALAQASASRAAFLPQATVSGTVSDGGITQLGMPKAQQNYVSINASWPLFDPVARQTATAVALDARTATFTQAQSMSDAMLAAVQSYEGALLEQAVYESRQTTVEYEQRHLRDVTAMVKAGAAPRYVLPESQAALAQAEQSAEDAAAQRDEAMNDLKFTLALELTGQLALADTLQPLRVDTSLETAQQQATASRPDVLAAEQQVAAAQTRFTAAQAAYTPLVTALAQTYTGASTPALGTNSYQVGVTASLPVLDGGSRSAGLHIAEADLARAQALLEQSRLSAQRDVANAWRELQAAVRNIESARIEQGAAVRTLTVASLRERSGKGLTLETLDALAQDALARESLLRAIARFNVAVATVHRAAGDTAI